MTTRTARRRRAGALTLLAAGTLTLSAAPAEAASRGHGAPATPKRAAIPLDAFNVRETITQGSSNPRRLVVTGFWDFRDDYIGGEPPDDFAAVTADAPCWSVTNVTDRAHNYSGQDYTHDLYLKDGGVNGSPIIGVRDLTSGFQLGTAHGQMAVTYELRGGCSDTHLRAEFVYEHNQGGNVTGVSASFGVLSVSYSGGGDKIQKSTLPQAGSR